jgi:RecA/RadA recombinase
MSTSAALDELLQNLGSSVVRGVAAAGALRGEVPKIVLGWPEFDALLPDGGLPRGVIELASPDSLGGATSVALSAVRAVHAKDARAFCAWIDPEGSLYAPGVAMAGADLARLLVVRSKRADLGRIAVKVASSRAFDVLVVDMAAVPFASAQQSSKKRDVAASANEARALRKRTWPAEVLVRKLALLAEEGGATVLLLTNSNMTRQVSWPVAMRLELARFSPVALSLRIAKDKRGRTDLAKTVPFTTRPGFADSAAG